jgi:hypothetical protein
MRFAFTDAMYAPDTMTIDQTIAAAERYAEEIIAKGEGC